MKSDSLPQPIELTQNNYLISGQGL